MSRPPVFALLLLLSCGWAVAQPPLIARFSTVGGDFEVLLDAQSAPATVANFVRYASVGLYDGTFIHRSTTERPFDIQIIQGGGYTLAPGGVEAVPTFPPIPLEAMRPNLRGTIAMARTDQPDSATSEWFFNLQDDSRLDPDGPGTGYAVFGRTLGGGAANVLDVLGSVPTYDFGAPFGQLPLFTVGTNDYVLTVYDVDVIPFRVTAARREPGGFRVDWPALSTNTPVHVERRASLSSGAWTVVSSNNTNATFLDTNAPSSGAFYRVVVP